MAMEMMMCAHFSVPCNSGEASGRRIDEQDIILPAGRIRDMLPHLHSVYILRLWPRIDAAPLMQSVLGQYMPELEQLHLEVELYDNAGACRMYRPPEYTLLSQNIPALEVLVVRDAFVRLESSLCANLRGLHLENLENCPLRLPLISFLGIVRNCELLEELWVVRYLDVRAPGNGRSLPVVTLGTLGNLREVRVADEPHIVSRILSHLVIPAHVDVRAIGYVCTDAHIAFRAMLPAHGEHNLPVLHEATLLKVLDTSDDSCILSATSHTHYGLEMELRRNELTDFGVAGQRDGSVFRSMVQSVDLFQDAPIDTLMFSGNLAAVPPVVWIQALARFPGVREIEIKDIPFPPRGSLCNVIAALASPSAALQEQVVCPGLERLRLVGAIHDPEFLDVVGRCLTHRVRSGAGALLELKIEMHPDRLWTQRAVEHWRQALSPLAANFELVVHEPGSWQGNILPDYGILS